LNNWLRNHATYDMDALDFMVRTGTVKGIEYTQTPEGVLLRGTGVCASYSDAFLLLANKAGVETVEVTGVVLDGDGAHAWNKSKVDGHWVAVDVTWNDTDGRGKDNQYLMIDDSEFTGAAAREEDTEWMVDAYLSKFATS
jgi:transglutaminase/protease-like cytokinesis protein 3